MKMIIDLRTPSAPKTDWKVEYFRSLKRARHELLALHQRRGTPDPKKMGQKSFARELALFETLSNTTYLPAGLEERKRQFDRDNIRRNVEKALAKLLAFHRRKGKQDPGWMSNPDFHTESSLFNYLHGGMAIPRNLRRRYLAIHHEFQLRAGTTTNW